MLVECLVARIITLHISTLFMGKVDQEMALVFQGLWQIGRHHGLYIYFAFLFQIVGSRWKTEVKLTSIIEYGKLK